MPQVWTHRRAGTDASTSVRAQSGAGRVRNPVPERPQIHLIELPLDWAPHSTQVYLIEGTPLTLVDTGVRSEASRTALESALEGLGYGLAEIERIVVTHAHRDHFGLVQTIRALGGEVECCVHVDDADFVEGYEHVLDRRVAAMSSMFRAFGVPEAEVERLHEARLERLVLDRAEGEATPVDRRLRDGDRIEWKDWGLTVLHAPGHTPGHMLLEDEEQGVLFTGDQVMGQAIPYAEIYPLEGEADPTDPLRRRPRFRGLVEMRRTLRRLRGRPFRFLLPGYGGVITRAERTIRDTLLYYDVRLQRIDRGLRPLAAMGQDVTAYEIWKALFPNDEPVHEMRAHLLLLIGALDCLEEDRLLVTECSADGVFTHHHR